MGDFREEKGGTLCTDLETSNAGDTQGTKRLQYDPGADGGQIKVP